MNKSTMLEPFINPGRSRDMCKSLIQALGSALMLVGFTLMLPSPATAQLQVTQVILKSNEGKIGCDETAYAKAAFSGSISADGPGTVRYVFVRSNGQVTR